MRLSNFVLFGSMATVCAAFTSCSKGEELYDSGAIVAQQKSEYATNFEKKYGPIDPNQTWDFATMEPISYLPSSTSAGTRAGATRAGAVKTSSSTMTVGKDVVDWMHEFMKAGKNNSQLGSPFVSKLNQTTFTIVPFYQGCATYFWELWMNVGGKNIHIWTKNQDVQYKTTANGEWQTVDDNGIPANAIEIQAPSYTFTADPDQNMYFYLLVWTGGKDAYDKNATPIRISSLDNKMLALDDLEKSVTSITVPQGQELTVIGCEDKSTSSDNDFEDLVFLMYGPPVIHIDEKEVRETKRYMIEDLGTTDDFDFNDVVVDVAEVYKKKLTFDANNMLLDESEIEGTRHQEAIVRAAGGTINFTIEIGTKTITRWTKEPTFAATNMVNTGSNGASINYDAELAKFNITDNDWDPATNNIRVRVDGKGETGEVLITFPKPGEAPMMIAVPDTKEWMIERSGFPTSWIRDWFNE